MGKGTGLLLLAAGAAALYFGRSKSATGTGTGTGSSGSTTPGGGGSQGSSGGGGGGLSDADRTRTGTAAADWGARNALCKRPMTLSAAERQKLLDGVVSTAYDAHASDLPAQPTPAQLDGFLLAVAQDVLGSCNAGKPSTNATRVASELARALWWQRTGQSGQ